MTPFRDRVQILKAVATIALTASCTLLGKAEDENAKTPSGGDGIKSAETIQAADGGEILKALSLIDATSYEEDVIKRSTIASPETRLQLLETYEEAGNWEMVGAIAVQILAESPYDQQALRAQTEALIATNNHPAALESAKRLAKLDSSAEVRSLVAKTMAATGRHAEAAKILKQLKASSQNPLNFKWQEELAFALFHSKQTAEAKAAFAELANNTDAPESERTNARSQMQLIDALQAQEWMRDGEPAKAVERLERLKKQHGSGTFPYQDDLAYAYSSLGDVDKARKAFG